MPKNPRAMVHLSHHHEEQLKLQSEIFVLENAERATRPRKNTRLARIVEEIYQIFDDHATRTGSLKPIAAMVFDYLRSDYAPPTIVKARKVLGITSIRRGGVWWWKFPKVAPNEAMENAHSIKVKQLNVAEEELRKLQRAAAVTLQGIMIDHRLYVENTIALGEMEIAGYSRNTTLRMKNDLKIVTKKIEGKWMWIWAHREVQDWLLNKLSTGPRPYQSLFIEAYAEYGWHEEVLKLARVALETVWVCIIDKVGHWRDMGIVTPDMPVGTESNPSTDHFSPSVVRNQGSLERARKELGLPIQPKFKPVVGDGVQMLYTIPAKSHEIIVDFEGEDDSELPTVDDYS